MRYGRYFCVPFARSHSETATAVQEIAGEADADVVAFSQMSPREIARNTGRSTQDAEQYRQREFSEIFFFAGETGRSAARFTQIAREKGWEAIRGEPFWELRGPLTQNGKPIGGQIPDGNLSESITRATALYLAIGSGNTPMMRIFFRRQTLRCFFQAELASSTRPSWPASRSQPGRSRAEPRDGVRPWPGYWRSRNSVKRGMCKVLPCDGRSAPVWKLGRERADRGSSNSLAWNIFRD